MKLENDMTRMLGLEFPVIMAPMFLVSNQAMVEAAMQAGIMGTFPSLNYREKGEYEEVLKRLNAFRASNNVRGSYGVNLIVQRTNPMLKEHLEASVRQKVPFFITSLGSPKEVIEQAYSYGGKVFCDVTNVDHARMCVELGCDGIIAVGQGAGGHAGPYPLQLLVPALRKAFPNTPIISAGGVATGEGIVSMLALGASGVSIGTRYIACHEAEVGDGYKNAIVEHGMKDIVMTDKISGTPCTIISTPYARKIGLHQNWFERQLATNKRTKKYFKLLVQLRGMKRLENALKPASYQTLWCAGQSVEMIDEVLSVKEITEKLERETEECLERVNTLRVQMSIPVPTTD
jgi:nitronate monooxygenase